MDGILLVIKPPAMTSFDVVAWLRRIIGIRKIGHAGTLDPAACGLLPVCIGKATKSIEWFSGFSKSYRVEMVLGVTTDTYDGEGNIIEERPVRVSDDAIKGVFQRFIGEYEQIPPMYSAVKVKGKRLYELAREGVEVERKGRKITVSSIRLLNITSHQSHPIVRFDVKCSKGTYIRSLCHDMGKELGCGAYMSFLIRTGVGPFLLEQAVTLEKIEECCRNGKIASIMHPVDVVFENFPSVFLEKEDVKRFMNGRYAQCDRTNFIKVKDTVRVYSKGGSFIGIGVVISDHGIMRIKPKKLFKTIDLLQP